MKLEKLINREGAGVLMIHKMEKLGVYSLTRFCFVIVAVTCFATDVARAASMRAGVARVDLEELMATLE